MLRNEGWIDRIIRAVVGLVLVGVGAIFLQGQVVFLWVLVVVGLILMVSGALGFCPLYRLFRFSTIHKPQYYRDAPPSRPWAYTNTDMVDSRVRGWGKSESRSAMFRSDNTGRGSGWGTNAEARAEGNRTMYRSNSNDKKTAWGTAAEERARNNRSMYR
jgi:hypothetical protein